MKWYNRLLPTDNHQGYIHYVILLLMTVLVMIDRGQLLASTLKGIGGLLTAFGSLSLYTAFFTGNTRAYTFIGYANQHSWGQRTKKMVNILGGMMWLIIGLILLKSR